LPTWPRPLLRSSGVHGGSTTYVCCSLQSPTYTNKPKKVLTDRFAQGSDSGNTTCTSLSSYCGGTWLGLRDRLDYITGMGFNAVWISPHVDNVDGGYHGYWAQDFYATNAHFGTRDDLTQLIEACHERDVRTSDTNKVK